MVVHLLTAALFIASSAGHRLPRARSSLASRESGESAIDSRLTFGSHPLLGGAPVPRTPEEIAAAKQPGYIHWAAGDSSGKRSTLLTRFSTAEHAFLGDSLVLQGPNGADLPPLYNFTLPNGLAITYGEINCLAGDFYGTYDLISDGTSLDDQVTRFNAAFALLATDTTRQPKEARAILAQASTERAAFAAAVQAGTDPSIAYTRLPDSTAAYELLTVTRPPNQPGYLGLAAINFDHFGTDARTAYNAGHTAALRAAAAGDLLRAYALNAFADHFLQDSFAAGHLRTPRRALHDAAGAGPADLCGKYMHDEDNAIGLAVRNPKGDAWALRGDNYLLDRADLDNVARAHQALQVSVGEVWAAFQTRTVLAPEAFGAWNEAPTLESARGPQELVPLFSADGLRRVDVKDRRRNEFTWWYTYLTTIAEIEFSGKWDYPITMT